MTDIGQIIVGLGVFALSLVGHAAATWYKLGRIEGKLDSLNGHIRDHKDDISYLYTNKADKKG
jgi:hypothetical protein